MNIHKNARLTAHSRAELVRRVLEEGQSRKAVALAYGVCLRTVGKWVGRFRSEGWDGLADRSSRPARLHRPTSAAVVEQIAALRRQRLRALERVLFAIAGTVVLVGALLAALVSPWFLLLVAFVGLNQWLYVLAGDCPMSLLLTRVFHLRKLVTR